MWISKKMFSELVVDTIRVNTLALENNTEAMKLLIKRFYGNKDNLSSVYGMFKNIDFPNSDKGVTNMK